MEHIRIYFGADIQGRDTVRPEDFEAFLSDHVTPYWPGFTLTEGTGYWQGNPETVRILSALVDDWQGHANRIARAYAREFSQDAVLVERSAVSAVDFVSADSKIGANGKIHD